MKKFGIGRKDKDKADDSEDTNRSRLFGSKKKKEPSQPASEGPYTQPVSASKGNPYAQSASSSKGDPYAAQSNPQPPAYDPYLAPPGPKLGNEKSPVPIGGYGGPSRGEPSTRPGGYGGLGPVQSQDDLDAGREALFGGARSRVEKQQQIQGALPPDNGNPYTSNAVTHESSAGHGYGDYGERQLTAEEEEEEDVRAAKEQIKFMKQQDVSSTRNALRIAAQAEETGRETLARLGAQGEMIHESEKHLDRAANQNKLAEEQARELKHLNRSMFAVKVDNPFTKSRRKKDRDEAIINKHHEEKNEREATRAAAYASATRQQETSKELRGSAVPAGMDKKKNTSERSKYQFEADSDDEAMEDEIDQNLDALHGAATRLNAVGRAMGKEVDSQNEHIKRITRKVDETEDQIVMNRARLDRIK